MKYEVVDKIRGTMAGISQKEMCEERNKEIMKYATMEKEINIQRLKYFTRISP